jgi:oligopeptide transport system permease protein
MATNTAVRGQVAVRPRRSAGLWGDAFGRLRKNRLAILGLVLVALFMFAGIFGPLLAPWPYQVQDLAAVRANGNRPLPPFSPNHFLGTDSLGRDLFSRLLDGARISVSVAFVVQFVILGIGVPVGAVAGWFGGRLDNFLMRVTDVVYAFPDLLFIILLSVAFRETFFGQALDGLFLVFVAIGLTSWVTVARLVRGQMLSLKETEFVEAAKAIGVPDRRIVTRHLLPNGIGPVIVAITHRDRRPAAAGLLGQPDRRGPEVRPSGAAPGLLPGPVHCACPDRVHLPGGWVARRARPQAQGQAVADGSRGRGNRR